MPENIRTTEEGEAQNNSSSSTPTAKDLAKNLSENTEPQYTIFEQIPVHSHGIRVICIAFKETLPGNTTPRYVLKIANNREGNQNPITAKSEGQQFFPDGLQPTAFQMKYAATKLAYFCEKSNPYMVGKYLESIVEELVTAQHPMYTITAPETTTHVEKEGFDIDRYITKQQNMGYNALLVTVNGGKHPLKQIGGDTARNYFIISGTGTFTINGEQKEVGPGNLITLQANDQYEYEGTMQMFEFNVSPSNTFTDKRL